MFVVIPTISLIRMKNSSLMKTKLLRITLSKIKNLLMQLVLLLHIIKA